MRRDKYAGDDERLDGDGGRCDGNDCDHGRSYGDDYFDLDDGDEGSLVMVLKFDDGEVC